MIGPAHGMGPARMAASASAIIYTAIAAFLLSSLLLLRHLFRSISPPAQRQQTRTDPMGDKKATEENIAQFCGVTGASTRDARRYIEKFKRLDVAIDAYYTGTPASSSSPAPTRAQHVPSTTRLNTLFDKYKDPDGLEITVDGTLRLCEDLRVDPEDVVLLAVAYELKSPRVGEWGRTGWTEGWKKLGCDTIPAMQDALGTLRTRLGKEAAYFRNVYTHTFEFARQEGQRSLAIDTAQAFWGLLLPHGLRGGALALVSTTSTPSSASNTSPEDSDDDMEGLQKPAGQKGKGGFPEEYVEWWFEFLCERGGRGVSKDTWVMLLDFICSTDAGFTNYDMEAAWPSTIDDFVGWAKKRLNESV